MASTETPGQEPEQQASFFDVSSNPKFMAIQKKLAESSSSKEKFDAMASLIAMMSKGKDVSGLFPEVVKNVICPDIHVKNLVYLYLIHYAESQQDLALLSINTFQKDLDNPNPRIRAQALRVLSSVRLALIAPIQVIAIQRCVDDASPYVRKTAAHAITKVFDVNQDHVASLVKCIQKLLADESKLVLGSAIAAFNEVCPDRFDLLHPHFRKLCNFLPDLNEWGQVHVIHILTRYARTQFLNPNVTSHASTSSVPKQKTSFYSDSESDSEDSESEVTVELDADHQLLLRVTAPLLQSHSSAVVIAVAGLYYHCAPKLSLFKVAKALVRLVRESSSVAYGALSNIATISRTHPTIFTAYLADFFVLEDDPTYVVPLKLEILTNLLTDINTKQIMAELNHYVRQENSPKLVTEAIRAIGRSGLRLAACKKACMHTLIRLLSSRHDYVVAESVVMVKKLMQSGSEDLEPIVNRLSKLLDAMTIPDARASIIWAIGEYCQFIPNRAPEIFRKLVLGFPDESVQIKLQIMNLGVKLMIVQPQNIKLQQVYLYLCNLAKFDTDYDIRDRNRVLRAAFTNNNTLPKLSTHTTQLFRTPKPSPDDFQAQTERDIYAIGSLSQLVFVRVNGYIPLPNWCTELPDRAVRDQVSQYSIPDSRRYKETRREDSSSSYSESDESSYSSDYDSGFSSDSDREGKSFQHPPTPMQNEADFFKPALQGRDRSESSSSEEQSILHNPQGGATDFFQTPSVPSEQLLDLPASAPVVNESSIVGDIGQRKILLKKVVGNGLEIDYQFLRRESIHGNKYSTLQLTFKNHTNEELQDISLQFSESDKNRVVLFEPINILPGGTSASALLNIIFESVNTPVLGLISHSSGKSFKVEFEPTPADLLIGVAISPAEFSSLFNKFSGFNEVKDAITLNKSAEQVHQILTTVACVGVVKADADAGVFHYTAKTPLQEGLVIMISAELQEGDLILTVKGDNPVFINTLFKQLLNSLRS